MVDLKRVGMGCCSFGNLCGLDVDRSFEGGLLVCGIVRVMRGLWLT